MAGPRERPQGPLAGRPGGAGYQKGEPTVMSPQKSGVASAAFWDRGGRGLDQFQEVGQRRGLLVGDECQEPVVFVPVLDEPPRGVDPLGLQGIRVVPDQLNDGRGG